MISLDSIIFWDICKLLKISVATLNLKNFVVIFFSLRVNKESRSRLYLMSYFSYNEVLYEKPCYCNKQTLVQYPVMLLFQVTWWTFRLFQVTHEKKFHNLFFKIQTSSCLTLDGWSAPNISWPGITKLFIARSPRVKVSFQ